MSIRDTTIGNSVGRLLTSNGNRLVELWDEYATAGYEKDYLTHSTRKLRKGMSQLFLPSDSGKFFDAGCGTGGMFETITQRISPVELYGGDWSEEMLKKAQIEAERLRNTSETCFNLLRIDLSKPLPWPDGFFDGAVSNLVICYLPYGWKEPLIELRRVIKPGGYLYLSTFLEEWDFDSALWKFAPKEFIRDPHGTLYGIRFRRIASEISKKAKRLGAELPPRDELTSFLEILGFEDMNTVPAYWGFGLALRAKVISKPLS